MRWWTLPGHYGCAEVAVAAMRMVMLRVGEVAEADAHVADDRVG